jgi:hypothetical protein
MSRFPQGNFFNWFPKEVGGDNPMSLMHAVPDGTPPKVLLAKLKAMIKKGLISGCVCGCRGDFELL